MQNDFLDSSRTQQFDVKWAVIALFGTLVSFFIAVAYTILRMGLTTPPALAPTAVAILAAAVFTPLLLPRRGRLSEPIWRFVAYPVLSLVVIASVLLSFILGKALLPLYAGLGIFGMLRAFRVALPVSTWRGWAAVLATAITVSAYLFIVVLNHQYAGVFTPEQGMLGKLNPDTKFHTAVAFLIQNFGMPSVGVDGMLPLKYHFGSHAWLAAFGLLVGAEPLWSYSAGVLIFAVPMLLVSLLLSGIAMDNGRKSAGSYLVIGLSFLALSDSIGWSSYYISESYTFGLIGLLLLLPVFSKITQEDNSVAFVRAGFVTCILAILFLMALKVSVGILWAFGVSWIALRRFGFRLSAVIVGGACICLLFIGVRLFVPSPADFPKDSGALFIPFYLLRVFPALTTLSSFVFPICLGFFTLATTGRTVMQALKGKSDLLVETVTLITILGALPAFLGIPQDSSTWYFLNMGQWYAMAVLIGRISSVGIHELKNNLSGAKLSGSIMVISIIIFLAQLVTSITPTFLQTMSDLLLAASQQGGDFLHGRRPLQYFRDSLRNEHVLFGSDFRYALAHSVGANVIAQTRMAVGSPRRDLAVFIPPANVPFWNFESECREKYNVQVSLTGQPSLFGEPPQSYGCTGGGYLVRRYGDHIDSSEMDDSAICRRARQRNIRDVFILKDLHRKDENRVLHCDP